MRRLLAGGSESEEGWWRACPCPAPLLARGSARLQWAGTHTPQSPCRRLLRRAEKGVLVSAKSALVPWAALLPPPQPAEPDVHTQGAGGGPATPEEPTTPRSAVLRPGAAHGLRSAPVTLLQRLQDPVHGISIFK